MEKHGAASQRTRILHAAAEVRQREFRSAQGLNKPGFYRRRQDFRFGRFAGPRIGRRGNRKRLGEKIGRALLELDAMVDGQMLEHLRRSAGPADGGTDSAYEFANAKEKLLGMLAYKSGAG